MKHSGGGGIRIIIQIIFKRNMLWFFACYHAQIECGNKVQQSLPNQIYALEQCSYRTRSFWRSSLYGNQTFKARALAELFVCIDTQVRPVCAGVWHNQLRKNIVKTGKIQRGDCIWTWVCLWREDLRYSITTYHVTEHAIQSFAHFHGKYICTYVVKLQCTRQCGPLFCPLQTGTNSCPSVFPIDINAWRCVYTATHMSIHFALANCTELPPEHARVLYEGKCIQEADLFELVGGVCVCALLRCVSGWRASDSPPKPGYLENDLKNGL